jgi:glycosyltransferase involved in cell wall biosynthesis
MEKYSVLMSLYIKEDPEYLKQAVNSMIFQTVKPDEIVIIKDGPLTDNLERVLNDFEKQYPGFFNIVSFKENLGLGTALNIGLEQCKNELVARMDTDDISKPDRCEKQLKRFEENTSLDIVGSAIDEFWNNPENIICSRRVPAGHKEIYEFSKRRSAFNHPTVMYKKSKVLALGGYSNLRRNQDVELFGRMLFAGCRGENLTESLLLFRTNKNLMKRRKSWANTISYIGTIFKFYRMGYAGLCDLFTVTVAQMVIFLIPLRLQGYIYKKFLRK